MNDQVRAIQVIIRTHFASGQPYGQQLSFSEIGH